MKKMLVISELYWPEKGGAELATHLVLGMLKTKYDITIVTGTQYPECILGLRYVYSKLLAAPNKLQLWKNLGILMSSNWFVSLLKGSDIVYIPRYSYPVISIAKHYNKKVIVHLHNYQLITYCSLLLTGEPYHGCLRDFRCSVKYELFENKSPSKALLSPFMSPLNQFIRYWSLEADELICVSNRQKEIIAATVPQIGEKLKVIYNPLPNVPFIEKKTSAPAFAYIGGDSYIKGFYQFLHSSREILKKTNNVTFLLMGNFSSEARSLIPNFKGFYKVMGHVKHEDVLKQYSEIGALFFPSLSEEPLPYAVIEAMLSGTLPVVSKVGGVPEIVQGTFAEKIMFTPADTAGSVDSLEAVLSLPEEDLVDIGVSLRENILQKFDSDTVRDELFAVFS